MRISVQFRQTLISTCVVGSFFGLLAALASFAFYSEYGPNIASAPHSTLETTLNVVGTLFLVTVGIVVVFSILPTILAYSLSRLLRKTSNSSSKRTRVSRAA